MPWLWKEGPLKASVQEQTTAELTSCHGCGKKGHLKQVCRSKLQENRRAAMVVERRAI